MGNLREWYTLCRRVLKMNKRRQTPILSRKVKKREKEKWTEAYFTVEATLIIPMVLVIFVLLIYLSFYLYDRCLIAQDAYILCFRSSILKEEPDKAQAVLAGKQRQYGSKYFAIKNNTSSAAENGKWIEMSGEMKIFPSVFQNHFLMPSKQWQINFKAKAKETDPVKGFRRFSRLQELWQKATQGGKSEGNA